MSDSWLVDLHWEQVDKGEYCDKSDEVCDSAEQIAAANSYSGELQGV